MTVSVDFAFRTGSISIDLARCLDCASHACVTACAKFGGDLFTIEDGQPALKQAPEETGRRCIEDLACEIYCHSDGRQALTLTLDMFGLNEYRQRMETA